MTTEAEWIKFLEEDHKISREVWQNNGLTFDSDHLNIPYHSPSGEYLFKKTRENPLFTGKDKYLYPPKTHMTLYLYHKLSDKNGVILTEGELDTLTLLSLNIPATTSGGVTSFKEEFVTYFKDIKVYICFDTDKPGKENAKRVALQLAKSGIEVWIVELPDMEGGKDIGDYFRLGHTKEEFRLLCKNAQKVVAEIGQTETPLVNSEIPLIETTLTFEQVSQVVENFLPNSLIGLKVILAIGLSAHFKGAVLLWMLLVGVPSSGKTDLVRLLKVMPLAYYLDTFTLNAFISGERENKGKVHDLLGVLNNKIFIIKDWTSIFSQDEKATKKVLGDLVNIYDKEFKKFSPTRGDISYNSQFSHLGCITPEVLNKHTRYLNMVGARFLFYAMPESTPQEDDKSFDNIFSNQDRETLEKDAQLYVSSYLNQLIKQDFKKLKPLSNHVKEFLKNASILIAHCRGIVVLREASFLNDKGETVKYYETQSVQIEKPWRALQQLIHLAKCLAFVGGKEEVWLEELDVVKDIVLSSMPADRSQALKCIKDLNGKITSTELSRSIELSSRTSLRLLDELTALKVVKKSKDLINNTNIYELNELFRDFILSDPTNAEFMSNLDNKAVGDMTSDEQLALGKSIFGDGTHRTDDSEGGKR